MRADPVTGYARAVLAGKEIAGPLVRAACERHLRDLAHGPKRGLKWDWSRTKNGLECHGTGKWACDFFAEVLKLAGGEHEGRAFVLEPSQAFIVGSLFGWKGSDGFRRFRVAYIEEGKGSGKSPLAAGIGLYMLEADDEARAEVYAAAVDKDQAKILFRDAVSMVDQSPSLNHRLQRSGGRGKEWNLADLATGSFFRPIASEYTGGRGKSGPRPHCVLLDEVHEHPSDTMVEFMRAGTKGRTQALILMITNAGVYDPTSVCFRYHEYSEKVLNGHFEDDSFFTYVCSLDQEVLDATGKVITPADDWRDPACWKKTNPLLGVTVSHKYLEEQVREAEGMPSKQSLVQRLNFCVWNQSVDPFVDDQIWKANGGSVPLAELEGKECYGGLDLSGKNDLTCLELVFPMDDGTKAVLSFFWTPAETLRKRQERDRAPYDQWVRDGFIEATPGPTIDYGFVAQKIGYLTKLYKIQAIGFDRYRIDDLKREIDAEGVDVKIVECGQGFKDISPAIEVLEDDLKERRLRHGMNEVLGWCISNARVVKDPAGNRKFDKRKATGRIDGAVALAMADRMLALLGGVSNEPQFFVLGG